MGEPRSLKTVFGEAEGKRLSLEGSFETTSPTYREDLTNALKLYQECLKIIGNVSLYSPNESLEDLATTDLPYLLVNHHLAQLVQRLATSTPRERRAALNMSRDAFERFLHLLDSYSILSASDKKLFELYSDDPSAFSTISTKDPTARRNAKISNFKAEKELKSKLEYMRNSPRYLEDGGDEEAVRELYLANIAFYVHMTFQGLESINSEMEILAMAPDPNMAHTATVEDDERRRAEQPGQGSYSERLDSPLRLQGANQGPLLSQKGKPLRPFTLTGSRQELRNGVFRPGHNLPTMSIDEYLDEERRRGGIIEGGGEASGRLPEPDEDNIEKADEETMKARYWDEYTEANPRGSGNTLNKG